MLDRRLRRRLLYCLSYWRNYPVGNALRWIRRRLIFETSVKARFGSVAIVDIALQESNSAGFVEATREALKIIQASDPRRFRRLEREVRYVVHREGWSAGAYDRTVRACTVDFARLRLADDSGAKSEHYNWHLAYYAAMLVHEATHGRVESLHIPYTRATRARIERICNAEQRRFAVRMFEGDSAKAARLVPEFDAKRWERHWNSTLWQSVQLIMVRLREANANEQRRKGEQKPG